MKLLKDNIEVLGIVTTILAMLGITICFWDTLNPKIIENKDSLTFISSMFGIVIAISSFFYTNFRMRKNQEDEKLERKKREKAELETLGNALISSLANQAEMIVIAIESNNIEELTPGFVELIDRFNIAKIGVISSIGVRMYITLLKLVDNQKTKPDDIYSLYFTILDTIITIQQDAIINNFSLTIVTDAESIIHHSYDIKFGKRKDRYGIFNLLINGNKESDSFFSGKYSSLTPKLLKAIIAESPNDILNNIEKHTLL